MVERFVSITSTHEVQLNINRLKAEAGRRVSFLLMRRWKKKRGEREMTDVFALEQKIKEIIDSLKGLCSQNGMSNDGNEERVITSVFLYKFLNDKFMYNLSQFASEVDLTVDEILNDKEGLLEAFYDAYAMEVAFSYEDTIQHLINQASQPNFGQAFDEALMRISTSAKNNIFNIETADGTKRGLFEPVTTVVEASARDNFAQAIFGIISQEKFDFSPAFERNFDFYSTIFEYLIKDYNVASGVYAEYFTPQAVSKIIAKILVGSTEKIQASEIYDPSAGSGSLVLHLAHELGDEQGLNRALVYTQDISNKSSRFLRINMLLNGLTESLHNAVQGDTLLKPSHFQIENDPSSGLKKFDYIVSNPPFKTDFSSTRNQIEAKWADTDRFFAGIPAVPDKKKESMAIYTLFIQHILFSLKENGKAAIVVPTGFITAKSGIEKKLRQKMIEDNMLCGVIQMPSNIFANTGTNVSILFLDKGKTTHDVLLMNASKLGTKMKDGKNQKTVLSHEEEQLIIETFIKGEEVEGLSTKVTNESIQEKNYFFSAGQYFEIEAEIDELPSEEFESMMGEKIKTLTELFEISRQNQQCILEQLGGLNCE